VRGQKEKMETKWLAWVDDVGHWRAVSSLKSWQIPNAVRVKEFKNKDEALDFLVEANDYSRKNKS